MLACGLDVKINYDIPLTILSAMVAILFTFIAFSSPYASEVVENNVPMARVSTWLQAGFRKLLSSLSNRRERGDIESGQAVRVSEDERRPILASTSDRGDEGQDDEDNSRHEQDLDPAVVRTQARSNTPLVGHVLAQPHQSPTDLESSGGMQGFIVVDVLPFSDASVAQSTSEHRQRTSAQPEHRDSEAVDAAGRTSEDSTPLTTDSSDDSIFAPRRLSSETSVPISSGTPTTLSSHSWSDPLHAGLSREARLRIKAQARDRPIPKFGWRYWFKQHYSTITVYVALRAAIWALAIVFMHYCGNVYSLAYT